MRPDPHSSTDEIHLTVEARLRLADQRYTRGRRRLVELLACAEHPLSIGEIATQLPDLPRSTAYRNLVDLQLCQLVQRVSANDEFARFELAEELTEHHHHLLCIHCGRVLDVSAPASFEKAIATAVDSIAKEHGFTPRDHRLDILGVCDGCGQLSDRSPF